MINDGLKHALDVVISFSTRLDVLQVVFAGELLSLLIRNFSLILEVAFGTNQDHSHVLGAVLSRGVDPFSYILKAFTMAQIETNYGTLGASIECQGEGAEAFRASRVPHLNLDGCGRISRLFHHADEVYSHGRLCYLTEILTAEDFDQLRLTNFLLSKQNQVNLLHCRVGWLGLCHNFFYLKSMIVLEF